MLFNVYVIDTRKLFKEYVSSYDQQAGWQLWSTNWGGDPRSIPEPMKLTARQVHLVTKHFKDCISGKYRTIEVVPA